MNALQRYFLVLTLSLALVVTVFWSYSQSKFKVIDFLESKLDSESARLQISNRLNFDEVILYLGKHNLKLFHVDPSVLYLALTSEEKKLLEKRNPNVTKRRGSKILTTLGVLEEHSKFLQNNSSRMMYICDNFFTVAAYDPRLLHWDPSKSQNSEINTHYFCVLQNVVLHIVVFIRRGNYFWIGGVNPNLPPELMSLLSINELVLGKTAAGFERFDMRNIANSTVLIPSDPLLFLYEMPNSKFLECNSQEVIRFHTMHPKSSVVNEPFNEKLISAIKILKAFLRPILAKFWIYSGTLLGWYRQCGNIPYTTDVDFAMFSWEMDPDLTEHFKKAQSDLKLKYIYGKLDTCYQYAFYLKNERIDLFFVYRNQTHFYDCGHVPSKYAFFRYLYPQYTVCSADMLGEKVFVPCETEKVIKAEYGEKWREPVKNWDYASSGYNIDKVQTWPPSQHKYAVQYV